MSIINLDSHLDKLKQIYIYIYIYKYIIKIYENYVFWGWLVPTKCF